MTSHMKTITSQVVLDKTKGLSAIRKFNMMKANMLYICLITACFDLCLVLRTVCVHGKLI